MKPLKGLPINLAALKPNPAALKGIPAVLRQPQWVAAILSVGFHGALFAAGPSFSNLQSMAMGAQGNREAERRVPIIELTAEEQSRLPNFDSPAYSFLPEDPLSGNSSSLMELFPPAGNRANPPVLPPLPEGLSAIPRMSTPRSSLGAPVTISPFPSRIGRNSIVIPPIPSGRPGRPAGANAAENRPEVEEPTASTPTSNRPSSSTDPSAEDLRPRDESATAAAGNNTAPLREEAAEVPPEVARSRELIARVEYSEDLTTTEESEAAATEWATTLAEELGEAPANAEETFAVEVPYDLRLCLNPEPSTGLLGFALLPGEEDGTLEVSTTLLKSTGYPFLNQAALQSLQTLVANSDTPLTPGTIYQAVVTVLYDGENCVDTETLLKSRVEEVEEAADGTTSPETKPEN